MYKRQSHSRARKYADAALGKIEYDKLAAEIETKRNKDLLMSIGFLPLPKERQEQDNELFKRYQFIQKFKKESRQFGAQRREMCIRDRIIVIQTGKFCKKERIAGTSP